MTEPSSAEVEAPIEDFGDSPPPDENTDTSEETVDENDMLYDFNPHDGEGWPDQRPDGGDFENVAFPPLDEGVK
jgi:hypothetical protein